MKYSVQQIEQALRDGKIISFGYKNLYQAKISEGQVVVFWGMNDKVGYSLPDFLNNFHNDGWICTKIEGEETVTNKPHKHAELIKLWAEGAIIQFNGYASEMWYDCDKNRPSWDECVNYRVKPTLVKKWKWVYEELSGKIIVTALEYASSEEFYKLNPYSKGKILQKVDSTMIEVEE